MAWRPICTVIQRVYQAVVRVCMSRARERAKKNGCHSHLHAGGTGTPTPMTGLYPGNNSMLGATALGGSLEDVAAFNEHDRKLRALQQHQLLLQQQQIWAARQFLIQQQMETQQNLNRLRGLMNANAEMRPQRAATQDMTLSIQSRLLTEFRNSKNKKYELKASSSNNMHFLSCPLTPLSLSLV